jgi:DNA-binding HxlR family transcriptional regulator
MKKSRKEAICPVDYAFRRIGGKYKGQIIWYIHSREGVLRYGELKKMIADISPKMLTQTLRELEEDKLISRKVYPEVPPKVEYSLTTTGVELVPFISHLADWGEKQLNINKQ